MRVRRAYLSGSVSLTRGRGGVASLRLAAPRSGVARERVPRWRGRAEPQPPRVPGARKHNPTGTRDARERALGARGGARDAHNAARGLTAALAAVERGLKRPRGVRHRERAGESRHGRSGSGGRVLSPGAFARRPVACAPLVSVARVRARGRTSAASACDELPLGAAAQPSSDARRGFTPGLRNRRDWTLIFWIASRDRPDGPMKRRAVPMNDRTMFRFLSLSKGHLGQRQFFPLSHTRRSERVRVRP